MQSIRRNYRSCQLSTVNKRLLTWYSHEIYINVRLLRTAVLLSWNFVTSEWYSKKLSGLLEERQIQRYSGNGMGFNFRRLNSTATRSNLRESQLRAKIVRFLAQQETGIDGRRSADDLWRRPFSLHGSRLRHLCCTSSDQVARRTARHSKSTFQRSYIQ